MIYCTILRVQVLYCNVRLGRDDPCLFVFSLVRMILEYSIVSELLTLK